MSCIVQLKRLLVKLLYVLNYTVPIRNLFLGEIWVTSPEESQLPQGIVPRVPILSP